MLRDKLPSAIKIDTNASLYFVISVIYVGANLQFVLFLIYIYYSYLSVYKIFI